MALHPTEAGSAISAYRYSFPNKSLCHLKTYHIQKSQKQRPHHVLPGKRCDFAEHDIACGQMKRHIERYFRNQRKRQKPQKIPSAVLSINKALRQKKNKQRKRQSADQPQNPVLRKEHDADVIDQHRDAGNPFDVHRRKRLKRQQAASFHANASRTSFMPDNSVFVFNENYDVELTPAGELPAKQALIAEPISSTSEDIVAEVEEAVNSEKRSIAHVEDEYWPFSLGLYWPF